MEQDEARAATPAEPTAETLEDYCRQLVAYINSSADCELSLDVRCQHVALCHLALFIVLLLVQLVLCSEFVLVVSSLVVSHPSCKQHLISAGPDPPRNTSSLTKPVQPRCLCSPLTPCNILSLFVVTGGHDAAELHCTGTD